MVGGSACYGGHEITTTGSDSGPTDDALVLRDAGQDAPEVFPDAFFADAGAADARPCTPDPDCNGFGGDGDGMCDWDAFNACCETLMWDDEACWLPGGPLAPPEMPSALA